MIVDSTSVMSQPDVDVVATDSRDGFTFTEKEKVRYMKSQGKEAKLILQDSLVLTRRTRVRPRICYYQLDTNRNGQ